ncbi:hypothetical protein DFH09DRAFT_1073116 [Mycena vulgaris]|nr:hypothetical protein DFH09DRAFT_1073116 [Mycena vulgaris]
MEKGVTGHALTRWKQSKASVILDSSFFTGRQILEEDLVRAESPLPLDDREEVHELSPAKSAASTIDMGSKPRKKSTKWRGWVTVDSDGNEICFWGGTMSQSIQFETVPSAHEKPGRFVKHVNSRIILYRPDTGHHKHNQRIKRQGGMWKNKIRGKKYLNHTLLDPLKLKQERAASPHPEVFTDPRTPIKAKALSTAGSRAPLEGADGAAEGRSGEGEFHGPPSPLSRIMRKLTLARNRPVDVVGNETWAKKRVL